MATYDVKQIALPGGDIANLKDGNAIHKSNTSGFVKNDGSIDQNTYQIAQEGKGLSTNDFTNTDKAMIGNIYGNNTVLTTDKTPFLTRQTLNPTGFSGYVREKLIGASYAWNQLVRELSSTYWRAYNTSYASVLFNDNVATVTILQNLTSGYYNGGISLINGVSIITGHKYLYTYAIKSSVNAVFGNEILYGSPQDAKQFTANVWGYVTVIGEGNSSKTGTAFLLRPNSNLSSGDTYQVKLVQFIDLTLAFGSTIADYLYGLSDNGGITKLRDMGCPIDQYTQYGYGLYSSKPSAKKIAFDNQLDGNAFADEIVAKVSGATKDASAKTVSYSAANIHGIEFSTCKFKANTQYSFYFSVTGAVNLQILYSNGTVTNFTANTWTTSESGKSIQCIKGVWLTGATVLKYEESGVFEGVVDTFKPYAPVTYSLGSTELRGHFILSNGEIVAEGDVRESNGNVTRNYGIVDLGTKNWTYHASSSSTDTNRFSLSAGSEYVADIKVPNANEVANVVCAIYVASANTTNVNGGNTRTGYISVTTGGNIVITDTRYTSPSDLKTALNGVYLIYEKATLTTETSTPFADPMSMVGATTEEYIDTRDIPCPVGAERQYMGQSEDIVEIPSSPLSDGKRKLVAETSGGKTQYYFEGDKNGAGTQVNLMTYNTSTNKYVCPSDGYISLSNAGASVGDYIIMSVYGANNNTICGLRCDTPVASMVTTQSLFVKRGMKCYVRATSSTGSFTALFTPLA